MYIPPNIKAILDHFDTIRSKNKKITWCHKVEVGRGTAVYVTKTISTDIPFCYDFSFDKSHKDHIETLFTIAAVKPPSYWWGI